MVSLALLSKFRNKNMDHILTSKIYNWLNLTNLTDAQIVEGAQLLLQCSPVRSRGIYNQALLRPKAMLPWIRTDLKKQYDIRQRGLTTSDVEKFNQETLESVKETLSSKPETIEDDEEEDSTIPELAKLGKRSDHDQLPDDIQEIWDKNADRWKRIRQLHTQLAQMISQPDYSPCDGNELCYQLRQLDTDLREAYQVYDSFALPEEKPQPKEKPQTDKVETFVSDVKTIAKARTAISRGLKLENQTEKSLQKLQDAVNTLYSLKQTIKDETVERLKKLGIAIPETENV